MRQCHSMNVAVLKMVSTQSCFMELIYRQQFMNVTLKSYVSLEIE